MHDYL